MNHMIDCYGNLAPGEFDDEEEDFDALCEYADDRNDERLLNSVE